ncbi:hypothetical protein JZU61_02475, partial [bacterium]|nr:hypothetical protein [bacterium]
SRLSKDGIVYSKGYFSQISSEGKIPHHTKTTSPKKFYRYYEVLEAIKTTQDPTRDAQREANEKKRSEPTDLFGAVGTYESLADMNDDERATYNMDLRREMEEARKAAEEAKAAGANDIAGLDVYSIEGVTLADAKILKEYWLGKIAELNYKKTSGDVIDNREVARQAFETARTVRNAILSIPSRISPLLAAKDDAHSIRDILTKELSQALEAISL